MLALSSIGLFSAFVGFFVYGGRGYWMPHAFGYGDCGGFFPFFSILKLLVGFGILTLIAFLAVRALKGGLMVGSESGKALEILKERYAKGEINEDEFKKMKKELLS